LYDYFYMPNGAFYGAKKACEPLHVQYNYKDNAVQVVNCYYRDFTGLTVTARAFDFNMKQIFSEEITTGIKADESKTLFAVTLPKERSNVCFLKLSLKDETGKELSSNFYWLSAKGDEDADFTDLATLTPVDVTTTLSPLVKQDGKLTLTATLANGSSSLAFGLNPKVLSSSTREPILPVYWDDNYFSLLPGEKRTVAMRVDAAQVGDQHLLFKLDGWNLKVPREEEAQGQ
jgi:exo-1,4-beta-D-glucosaminidase